MTESRSLVEWFSKTEKHKCGYCNDPLGSVMFGMWAYRLKVEDYQTLIDRGWRRSGQYCYKPVMQETCCPLYTIRCHALDFRLTKSQKKVLKKMNKFLKTGVFKEREKKEMIDNEEGSDERIPIRECTNQLFDIDEIVQKANLKDVNTDEQETITKEIENTSGSSKTEECHTSSQKSLITKQRAVKIGLGADPNRPPCKKAKLLRYEKKINKENDKGNKGNQASKSESKSLEDFLNDVSDDNHHKLQLKLIEPTGSSSEWNKYEQMEFELYKKYQNIIHNDPLDKITLNGFLKFLVKTPLTREKRMEDPKVPAYGSYHQQYWLDDKLIAVGVIDILPKCVSAVYFFYDPDYRELTLGTYGALKEIQLSRELYPLLDTSYYYMGYYVHSCTKMRYKGNMHPSDLLCPETYHWIPIEKCLNYLNKSKYSRFNDDLTAMDLNDCTEEELDGLTVIYRRRFTKYRNIKNSSNCEEFKRIGHLIGKKAAKNLILVESS